MSTRIYTVNEDFFKVWTKESAWMYGWFVGDGWVSEKILGFSLARKDKEVLYKFKKVMKSEHPVNDYESYDKRYDKTYEMSRVQIGSEKIVEVLKKLYYEDVSDEFLSDFIRGFFEAEGSVWLNVDKKWNNEYIKTTFTQKDHVVLRWIWCRLDVEGVVDGGHLSRKDLQFSEVDSVSLYHYLYGDCGNLYLDRKKSRFEELMARRGYL